LLYVYNHVQIWASQILRKYVMIRTHVKNMKSNPHRRSHKIYYLCAKTTSTRHSMQVCVGIFWHIIIEYNVYTFYVHTPSEQVCRHQNTLKISFVFQSHLYDLFDSIQFTLYMCWFGGTWCRLLTFWKSLNCWYLDNRSSCVMPRWIPIAGKFCSVKSCAKAIHLCTDFTNMTTYTE